MRSASERGHSPCLYFLANSQQVCRPACIHVAVTAQKAPPVSVGIKHMVIRPLG